MSAIPRSFTIFGGGRAPGGIFYGANGQTITGNSSGAWAVAANGSNQDITLTPSGTGSVVASKSADGKILEALGGAATDNWIQVSRSSAVHNIGIDGTGAYVYTTGSWRVRTNAGTLALTIGTDQNAAFVGRIRLPDGTLAAPALAFSNQTALGIYANGTNNLSISTGGTLAATFDGFGGLILGGGVLATTNTDGFLYIRACAGTPTGVPSAVTGRVPIVIDSTNNKLYFYSGGAWRDAGP